jgi:hypothetical protein
MLLLSFVDCAKSTCELTSDANGTIPRNGVQLIFERTVEARASLSATVAENRMNFYRSERVAGQKKTELPRSKPATIRELAWNRLTELRKIAAIYSVFRGVLIKINTC